MSIVKGILKETVSDQANNIADWSPFAFKRGLTMISNDYSGSAPEQSASMEKVDKEFDFSNAIHELAALHRATAEAYEAKGRKGAALWHKQIASRLQQD